MSNNGRAISAMASHDLPAILAIEQQSPSPWSMTQLEGEFFGANGLHLVCTEETNGRICGYVMSRHIADEAEILRLGVNIEDRRRGIASLLLKSLLQNLRYKSVNRCHLELRGANTRARSLYEKFDFVMTGRRKNYYTDPQDDAVCMSMDIPEEPSAIPHLANK